MEPTLITLEPQRVNALLKWWSQPEAAALLECLDKSNRVACIQALELQSKAAADRNNPQFHASALEKLNEAADILTTIKVLKSFFPDGPFISRIEL